MHGRGYWGSGCDFLFYFYPVPDLSLSGSLVSARSIKVCDIVEAALADAVAAGSLTVERYTKVAGRSNLIITYPKAVGFFFFFFFFFAGSLPSPQFLADSFAPITHTHTPPPFLDVALAYCMSPLLFAQDGVDPVEGAPAVMSFVGSHMDVVPANPETWNVNPFELTVDGDKVRDPKRGVIAVASSETGEVVCFSFLDPSQTNKQFLAALRTWYHGLPRPRGADHRLVAVTRGRQGASLFSFSFVCVCVCVCVVVTIGGARLRSALVA